MPIELSMHGRIALVTGGAGGIGSAICDKLAEAGAKVILTYRASADKANAVVARLTGDGHFAACAPVDDSDALKQLAAQVTVRFDKLDLLVNCAGITRPVAHSDLDALDDMLIDQIFRVNWRGAFASVRAFKELLAREGGTVVNISSVAAVTGIGSNVAYCASKAALDSMTRSLARALAPQIRVVSVSPGWVLGEYAARMNPAYLEEQRQKTPLNRIATGADVANAVLAVATMLTFSTGSIVTVDGGRLLS